MNHDHRSDKHRLNAITMLSYTVLVTILALSYLVEILKQSRTVPYFIVFLILLISYAGYYMPEIKNLI